MPRLRMLALLSISLLALPAFQCSQLLITLPADGQLSAPGNVTVQAKLPPTAVGGTAVVELFDGTTLTDVTNQLSIVGHDVTGSVAVPAPGSYELRFRVDTQIGTAENQRAFEVVALANAGECEILNAATCLLPFPSTRFLDVDGTTPTGFRLNIPQVGLPVVNGDPLDPTPFGAVDGFSPVAPILMHLPTGVGIDLALSGADILVAPDPGNPQTKPYVGIRTHTGISLQPDSPTVLMRASTGERILHFAELDSRSAGDPSRQTLILRPAAALVPGERYIVAVRNLVDANGDPIPAEPVFANLRDARPSTIAEVEARRAYFEDEIFAVLGGAPSPVQRDELQLAFDYRVQSSAGLTGQMVSMRDQAYAWLADQVDVQHNQTFSVLPIGPADTDSNEFDCNVPGTVTWRILRGTYQVPLFLTEDLATVGTFGVVNVDANGVPLQNGTTNVVFTLSIPCSARLAGTPAPHTLIVGHGLFGTGDGMVLGVAGNGLAADWVTAGTDWRGLSNGDFLWVGLQVIGLNVSQLNHFPAFVARLKQGQLNTLLLARMLKRGDFNVDPLVEVDTGVGALPGPSADEYYFGVSLGGIMGTFFASLTQDVERFNVDVPAINFSTLLQRSTQFDTFESLLTSIGLTDPMEVLVGLSLQHELWVSSEPAGYVHLLAPQIAANQKKVLMTVAWLDKQVSNQASEIMARSLGLGNHEGSVIQQLVDIPDTSGPVDSAMVVYDTGYFDIYDPAHQPFIPELVNQIPSGVCDPHADDLAIPASMLQLAGFMQPGGQIVNYCTGICDGGISSEQPNGGPPCDPLAP